MKITIESTTKVVELNGLQCRVWEGETEYGVKLHAFIPVVAAQEGQDLSQFDKDLREQKPPSADLEFYPQRMMVTS
jgi:hypothetical protein